MEGTDFTRRGSHVTCTPDSRLTTMKATDLPAAGRTDFPWYDTAAKQVVVTYTHDTPWRGPVPGYQGDRLPRTVQKLDEARAADHRRLRRQHHPRHQRLGVHADPALHADLGGVVRPRCVSATTTTASTLYNTGLGGMTSQWGAGNADSAVASLDPDLVIVAFGMNDFWSISPNGSARTSRPSCGACGRSGPRPSSSSSPPCPSTRTTRPTRLRERAGGLRDGAAQAGRPRGRRRRHVRAGPGALPGEEALPT